MKAFISICSVILFSAPVLAQGLQDGSQGSGGDEQAVYAISVARGWNIVSVPIVVSSFLKTSVFPTSTTPAYAYQGGFVPQDTLETGRGYWLKFAGFQGVALGGSIIYTDSVPVVGGWNLIGSISDPISSSAVTSIGTTVVSNFFCFDSGFQVAGTLEPGRGHWVKTSSSGTLVLSSGNFLERRSVQDSIARALARLNSITIADASGGRQKLFFGAGTTGMEKFFDLPPVPPSGIFDVRFASHKMVACEDENIALSSAVYPVDIQWNIVSPGNYALVVDGKEITLKSDGALRLARSSARLSLRVGSTPGLPKEFGLSQNYPNPFNPTTTIKFALPFQSQVRMELYSILGQRVATMVDGEFPAGYHVVSWEGTGNDNVQLGSGVYFYRMSAIPVSGGAAFNEVKKMMLMK